MSSVVKYLKVIGGTSGKEQILVGLHNGQVFDVCNKLYINSYKHKIIIGFDVTS